MPRKATGTIQWAGDHYKARITLNDGSREWLHLRPGLTEEDARAKARGASERARRENRVKERHRSGGASAAVETLEEWCGRWLEERDAKGHANTDSEKWNLGKYMFPRFGDDAVTAITRDDIESIVEDLDRRIATGQIGWKTAWNVWSIVTTMFADATNSKVRALRVRKDNPALGVRGPDRGGRKTKSYLYPSEFLALVSSPRVPLADRRLFALAVYLFVRPGELEALTWNDFDIEHGSVDIHQSLNRKKGVETTTKTEAPRKNPLEPELVPLLRVMHDDAGGKGRVAPRMLAKLAPFLRRCLGLANVKRAALFTNTKTVKQITFYDLRATGITWMAVRGDKPEVIKRRAGHTRYETSEGYIREAENLNPKTFGTPFPPLPKTLLGGPESSPESSSGGSPSDSTNQNRKEKRGGGAGNRTRVRKLLSLCFYVRSRRTGSPRVAPIGGLSPALDTCLISRCVR
jgi:integrase